MLKIVRTKVLHLFKYLKWCVTDWYITCFEPEKWLIGGDRRNDLMGDRFCRVYSLQSWYFTSFFFLYVFFFRKIKSLLSWELEYNPHRWDLGKAKPEIYQSHEKAPQAWELILPVSFFLMYFYIFTCLCYTLTMFPSARILEHIIHLLLDCDAYHIKIILYGTETTLVCINISKIIFLINRTLRCVGCLIFNVHSYKP